MPDIIDPHMTPTWVRIYEFIRHYWIENGHAPSQTEIMRAVGCSMASIQNGFRELNRAGHIHFEKHQARSVKPTDLTARLYREQPDPWASFGDKQPWEL